MCSPCRSRISLAHSGGAGTIRNGRKWNTRCGTGTTTLAQWRFLVEQHCHNFDKASWVFKGESPIAATGVGGRQVRTDPKFGNIYDHFAVTLEFPNGVKLFSSCRQMAGCSGDINDHVIGTKGSAQLMKHTVAERGGKTGVRRRSQGYVSGRAR